MTARIFVAGFHHETNTFAPSFADWAAFAADDGYPGHSRGEAMLARMADGPFALGGFAQVARHHGWRLVPSSWAGAMPSNRVRRDAFERLCGEIVDDLRAARAAGGVDGIFLDLHGAAVAEGVDDAEGELLARVRAAAGDAVPIVASLDLHANVTERMLATADAMTAYRTYPHVDMRETGERAAALLSRRLQRGRAAFATAARRVPFLLPLNAQCSLLEPAASVLACLGTLEASSPGLELSFAMGFSAADFAECGPVVFGHGPDAEAVRAAVDALWREVVDRRRDWAVELLEADDAVDRGLALASDAAGPVVLADTQDNPGAGGDANTTGLLAALLRAGAGRRWPGGIALGLLFDPEAAAAAHAAGAGSTLTLRLGRAVPLPGGRLSDPPVQSHATVRRLHDGHLTLHGPMTAGLRIALGPCACVEVDGVLVAVASAKAQMLDLDLFRFLGIAPEAMRLLAIKSSVHFRAAFAPIASHILVAKAPGPMAADPGDLPWRHLAPGTAPRP